MQKSITLYQTTEEQFLDEYRNRVIEGLSQHKKTLPSQYIYD